MSATKLFTIVADTMGGGHDTIGGCCSAATNMFRYQVPDTPSCYGNFLRALAPHGMGEKDIVANINFFMSVPVMAEGTWASCPAARSRATTLTSARIRGSCGRLELPAARNPGNGFNPTPVRVVVTGELA